MKKDGQQSKQTEVVNPKQRTDNKQLLIQSYPLLKIKLKIVKNGAPEARIESPLRKSRCTIPDGIESTKETERKHTKNRKQQLASPKGGDEEEESQDQDVTKDTVMKRRNNQSSKNDRINVRTRSDKTKGNKGMKEERRNKENKETAATNEHEVNKVIRTITMTTNGTSEVNQIQTSSGTEKESNNGKEMNDEINKDKSKNNNNIDSNGEKSTNNNKDGGEGTQKVSIVLPTEMDTYAFTVSWRPEQKPGKDGKIIIKNLMWEMAHQTPSIIFHPTNTATSPVPRDINSFQAIVPLTGQEKGVLF
jgi:hypothetical protein